jgi:hypothetical protein
MVKLPLTTLFSRIEKNPLGYFDPEVYIGEGKHKAVRLMA